ncbi:recombinase RecT, partial [Rhizobium ecuadorense]
WVDDDGEHLFHEEADEQDRKIIRRVYAQVVMKSGGCFVDTMRSDDIEKVRQSSKNKDSGPWVDWWEEMAFKTVFRHLSKRLPFSREVSPILDRDN